MIKNYFLTAVRNFTKQKGYSIINLFGLAVGIACCLLILFYVEFEMSYDDFQVKGDRLYRVALERSYPNNRVRNWGTTSPLVAETVPQEFPEVEEATKIFSNFQFQRKFTLQIDDKTFFEYNIIAADSNFYSIFSIPLLQGDPATALKDPNTLVLSESAAKRYFGDADPMGKTILFNGNMEMRVTGVSEEVPENSHFDYNINFAKLYDAENKIGNVAGVFSIIAVLISSLGLLGLAAYTTEQRAKEIGVRKVLGASVPNIMMLLSKDYAKLILISVVAATPIAYYMVYEWLKSFAYIAGIPTRIFILSFTVTGLVAFVTISFQTIRSALANPADSIRSE